MSNRTGHLLGIVVILLFSWFVVAVVIPDHAARANVHYTISTTGADGKEGQRWEHVRIVVDSTHYVRFTDAQGREVEVTGPRVRIKE